MQIAQGNSDHFIPTMTDKIPCTLNVTPKDNILEVAFVSDWVLGAEFPTLKTVFAQLGDGKGIKQLMFSTKELGRWDSLLMIGLISLVYAVPEQTGVRHKETQYSWLAFIGNAGLELFKDTQALIVFIGEIALSLFALIRRKTSFRLIDFLAKHSRIWAFGVTDHILD
jgi:phospholipid/cholesterol/gamma-HCH transport system permease protein